MNKEFATNQGEVLSLRRNFSWTAVGNVVYSACQWGVVTALAKLGQPGLVGQFALALAITAPVMQFFSLHLRSVQATDSGNEFNFRTYLLSRTLTTVLALIAIAGVVILSSNERQTQIVIFIVALGKCADAFSDVFYGMFQHRERMDIIARSLMFNGALSLVLLLVGFLLTNSIVGGVIGYSIGSLIPLVIYVVPSAIRIGGGRAHSLVGRSPANPVGSVSKLIMKAFPLGVVALMTSLISNVPRYFVDHNLGDKGLGIFAALAYLIVAGGMIVSALGQSASPRLSQFYSSGKIGDFRVMIVKLMCFGMSIGLAGALLSWAVGDQLLRILYTSDYAFFQQELTVMALAAGVSFAGSFAGYGVTAARMFSIQVPVVLVTLLASIGLSALFIPIWGVLGAAFVVLGAQLVQLILFSIVLARACQRVESQKTTGE